MAEIFNNEAERTILGAILVEPKDISTVAGKLKADEFYRVPHQIIYSALISLFHKGTPIDLVTLKEAVGGDLEKVGGVGYLGGLLDGVPRISNLEKWADIVREKATIRNLKRAANEILAMCEEPESPEILVDSALAEVMAVAQRATAGTGYKKPAEVAKSAMLRLERISQKGITGLETGIHDFDDLTNGLNAPDLIVFAGRPAMGKTAAVTTIATNVAAKGHVVGFTSLEMGADQIGVREISKEGDFNPFRLKSSESDWEKAAKGFGIVSKLPVYVDDDPYLTLTQVLARARQLQAEHGLDLLVIDYLQLLHAEGKSRWDRQYEIASIARGLKNLAKTLNVPVIAASQLSREVEKRTDKRPGLADLRESGEIEQAADIVVLLYRDYAYDNSKDPEAAEWILAKNRNGQGGGTIHVRYIAGRTTFVNKEVA